MIEVIQVQEMLRLEAEVDLPEYSLMRTAAFGLYVEILEIARENFGTTSGLSVLGLIGSGNNGSDALWAMSLLSNHGIKVQAIDTTGKRIRGYADELYHDHAGIWVRFDDVSSDIDIIIDGIAGLRNQYPPSLEVMSLFSNLPETLIVAVDMPSCFDNDKAKPIDENAIIHADYTVTFGYFKPCHVFDPARSLCGEVRLVELPISSPQSVTAELFELTDVAALLAPLDTNAYKYSHGVLGVIAGSDTFPGAGELAVLGSQWGGAGYIQFVGSKGTISPANIVRIDAVTGFHEKTDTVVFGPGVGVNQESKMTFETLLKSPMTLVLDADAITLLAENVALVETLVGRSALTILTPHHGEATRLAGALGISTEGSVQIWVSEIARRLNALVSYKSAHGFVASSDGTFILCDTTSSALATAGTGDVLAGLMGSLIARNQPTTQRALASCAMGAVIIHSIAAQLAQYVGVNPTALEIANQIQNAMALLEEHYD